MRLRPTHRNHVWSWDFVMDRTNDGRPIKMLTLIDEFTKESLAIYPTRRIRSHDNRVRPHSALGYRPPTPETMAIKLTMESRIGQTQRTA